MSNFAADATAGDSDPCNAQSHRLIRDTRADLAGVPVAFRQAAAAGPTSQADYQRCAAEVAALRNVELREPPTPTPPPDAVRVAFWNLERCKYVEDSAARLATVAADVNLLCELDLGMARSSQRHTARELAARLGQGYAFAVEFVELDLGNEAERARHAGEENAAGLHGNAILSRGHLARPVLIRLDAGGQWFDGRYGERRLGGRIALAATMPIAGVDVAFFCTHFESRGDPRRRRAEMRALLAGIEEYARGGPVIMSGDFNTNTASRDEIGDPGRWAALLGEDPDRSVDPVPHEPLFDAAAAAGFDWHAANHPGPTQRPHTAPRCERRLDWFFTRGLRAWDPRIVSAVHADGRVLSDHDMISVMIAPEPGA